MQRDTCPLRAVPLYHRRNNRNQCNSARRRHNSNSRVPYHSSSAVERTSCSSGSDRSHKSSEKRVAVLRGLLQL